MRNGRDGSEHRKPPDWGNCLPGPDHSQPRGKRETTSDDQLGCTRGRVKDDSRRRRLDLNLGHSRHMAPIGRRARVAKDRLVLAAEPASREIRCKIVVVVLPTRKERREPDPEANEKTAHGRRKLKTKP